MKHTPGPWVYQHGDIWEEARKHMTRRGKIADVSIAYLDSKTRDANAHLIAAAPDLLEALERSWQYLLYAVKDCEERGHQDTKRIAERDLEMLSAAIAKAKGK